MIPLLSFAAERTGWATAPRSTSQHVDRGHDPGCQSSGTGRDLHGCMRPVPDGLEASKATRGNARRPGRRPVPGLAQPHQESCSSRHSLFAGQSSHSLEQAQWPHGRTDQRGRSQPHPLPKRSGVNPQAVGQRIIGGVNDAGRNQSDHGLHVALSSVGSSGPAGHGVPGPPASGRGRCPGWFRPLPPPFQRRPRPLRVQPQPSTWSARFLRLSACDHQGPSDRT